MQESEIIEVRGGHPVDAKVLLVLLAGKVRRRSDDQRD
jgi:hypothetical protein